VRQESGGRDCIPFSICGRYSPFSLQRRTRNVIARDCTSDSREKPNQFLSHAHCGENWLSYRPRAGVALATSRLICRVLAGAAFGCNAGSPRLAGT
jgi:hypothetical protein